MTSSNYPDNPEVAGLGGPPASDGSTASTSPSSSDGSAESAKDRIKQGAGTAADEGRHVAGVAQGEAQRVAAEAKSQAHGLWQQATSEIDEQSRSQRDRLVQTLRAFGDDVAKMASNTDGGLAGELAHQVADRTRSLSSRLDGREPRDLLEDVRSFARRRPGTFLAVALAAGVVVGRFARGARDATAGGSAHVAPEPGAAPTEGVPGRAADVTSPGDPLTLGGVAPSSGPGLSSNRAPGTAEGQPLSGVDAPATDPVYPAGSDPLEATGDRS